MNNKPVPTESELPQPQANQGITRAQLQASQRETQKILKLANLYKRQITQLEMQMVDREMQVEELQAHIQKLEAALTKEKPEHN